MNIRKLKQDHPLSIVHEDLLKKLARLKKQPGIIEPDTIDKPFDDFFAEYEIDDRSNQAKERLQQKHKNAVSDLKEFLSGTRLKEAEKAILKRFELFHPKDENYYCAREALRNSTDDKNKNLELRQLGADLLEHIDNYHEHHIKTTQPENDEKKAAKNKKHKETFTQIYECLKIGIDSPHDLANAENLKNLVKQLPKKELSYVGRIVRGVGIFLIALGILFTAISLTLLIISSGGAAPVIAAPLALATLSIIGGLVFLLKRYSLFGKHTDEYQRNQDVSGIKHQLGLFQRTMLNPPPPAAPDDADAPVSRISASAI